MMEHPCMRLLLALMPVFFLVSCEVPSSHGSSQSSSSFSPDATPTQVPTSSFLSSDYLYAAKEGDRLSVTSLEQATTAGDATLYKYGDFEMLVDGGMPLLSNSLSSLLRSQVSDGVLDLLILTHQHYDHFGGLVPDTFRNAGIKKVTTFIDNGVTSFNKDYLRDWIEGTKPYLLANGSEYHPIQDFFSGTLMPSLPIAKDVTLAFLDSGYYPVKDGSSYKGHGNPNEESIGFVLYLKGYEIVSLGDAIETNEASYIRKYGAHPFRKEGDKLIFKANHHGSSNANSGSFMDFLKPDYCFISAAIRSINSSSSGIVSVQEPFHEVRERLERYAGIKNVYWTATTGDLTMSFDPAFTSLSISGAGRKIGSYYLDSALVDPSSESDLPVESTEWAIGETSAFGY